MLKKGKTAATRMQHAQVLLALDETGGATPWKEARITEAYRATGRTIENIRRRFVENGFEAALERKKRERPPKSKIDGEAEAKILTLACSAPPAGRCRWTLKLLADKVVEMEILDSISRVAIGTLLKNAIKPWQQRTESPRNGVCRWQLAASASSLSLLSGEKMS